MSWEIQNLTIQRATRTGDGAGGKALSWSSVSTARGSLHYYSAASLKRLEQSATGSAASGPGVNTQTRKFVRFEKPYPTSLLVNDRIVDAAGTTWAVRFVRRYSDSCQADLELIS